MNSEIDRASTALFADGGINATNVKFFMGFKRDVTAEQLAAQLNRADAQVRAGAAVSSKTLDGDIVTKTA